MKSFGMLSLLALGLAIAPATLVTREAAAAEKVVLNLQNQHASMVTCTAYRFANNTWGAALGGVTAQGRQANARASFAQPGDVPQVRLRCAIQNSATSVEVKPFTFDTAKAATHEIMITCTSGTLMCMASQRLRERA